MNPSKPQPTQKPKRLLPVFLFSQIIFRQISMLFMYTFSLQYEWLQIGEMAQGLRAQNTLIENQVQLTESWPGDCLELQPWRHLPPLASVSPNIYAHIRTCEHACAHTLAFSFYSIWVPILWVRVTHIQEEALPLRWTSLETLSQTRVEFCLQRDFKSGQDNCAGWCSFILLCQSDTS